MSIHQHPNISVLMPVYNTEKFVAEAVESILSQTLRDFEFIIIDDGSTDRSLDILRQYEKQDSRIRLISRENRGLVKTRNELLHEAKGELLVWADSDDVSYPSRVEKQEACFRKNPAMVWCRVMFRLVDSDGCPIRTVEFNEPGLIGVAAMRRETGVALGGFREQLRTCEDRDMELRMEEVGDVAIVNEVLLDYRQHPGSICNSQRMGVSEYAKLVDRLAEERRTRGNDALQRGESFEQIIPETAHRPESAWRTHSRWAWWALAAGNIATARKHAFCAVKRNPLRLDTWKVLACAMRGY